MSYDKQNSKMTPSESVSPCTISSKNRWKLRKHSTGEGVAAFLMTVYYITLERGRKILLLALRKQTATLREDQQKPHTAENCGAL